MRPISRCLIVLALLTAPSWRTPLADDSNFHPPQTDAEKRLDLIFRLDNKEHANLLFFAIGRPWYDPAKNTGYERLFTNALLKALRAREADLVREDCDGKYRDGEICGFDFDPIICAQDVPNAYEYRTTKSDKTSATIVVVWAETAKDYFRYYRLIKEMGAWKLDGIYCREGDTFNMPSVP